MALHNSLFRKNVRIQGGGYHSFRPRTISSPNVDTIVSGKDFDWTSLGDGHRIVIAQGARRGLPSSAALSRDSMAPLASDPTRSSILRPPTTRIRAEIRDVSELSDGQILGLLQLYASENIANHGAHNAYLLRRISEDPTRWQEWVDRVNEGLYKVQYKVIKDGADIYDFNLIQGYKIADLLDEIQLRSVNNPALSKGAESSSGLGQNALLYGGLGLAALLAYRRFSKKK